MPMTPEQIAGAILKSRRGKGRGTAFQPEKLAQDWLHSTPWFCKQYTTPFDQRCLIIEVARIMRSKMGKKSAKTRAKNKAAALKRAEMQAREADIAADEARQSSFKF